MKIRNGFVSNSSSSSFVIIHKDSNISKEDLIKKTKEAYDDYYGEEYSDARIDWIKKLANNNEYAACIVSIEQGCSAEEDLEKIIKKICTVFNIKDVRLVNLE